ncbi:uncharacterized protein [Parasteatoda tepidariorum]|uniref:uncharacterized protein n=1 Tax=Parasteatoda tepidariorum TaxID=114398 RepID=UPI001C71B20F|nr:uncharacterized protein LOC110283546 [Parasteatoda tepidariorum]
MCSSSLNYRDFLLLLKSLQLKETPDETICCCNLKEEDINFYEEETSVERYQNIITPDNRFVTSFKLDCIIKPIIDEDATSADKLKKVFKDTSPSLALKWCGRFLIRFHEKNQCTKFLTSAMKFYLKSMEAVKRAYFHYNVSVDEKVLEFLRLACKHRLPNSVFFEILRVFYITDDYYLLGHSFEYTPILEDILKITQDFNIDILHVWKTEEEIWRKSEEWRRSYKSFYSSLFENVQNFIPLIRFGKMQCFSIESYSYLKSSMDKYLNTIAVENDYSITTFRSLQILHSFFSARYKFCFPTTAAYSLNLLWNSITDPFLRQEDFERSLIPKSAVDMFTLEQTWSWYSDHVLKNEICTKEPRSLFHLSRCSVRRQLAVCLQLPCGVEKLFVPKSVKEYILLEHCNDFLTLC